jgi:hypothetical protein
LLLVATVIRNYVRLFPFYSHSSTTGNDKSMTIY